ncbi:PorP/SprF family type IX secretion system membrane protein [Pedobacter endophyticus]|uniref:Type IX secretion system membrane protein PorP/SprF n=1 Tax=Pedobacter endophyticus TaxID=2789740 RepID=A0A7S9KYQ5_9SPHI|nr:type IX secretion system membrane protein PorP/SprF [Pedobacter endophyticus]QPH39299.1 type IX secretion system membrane protein PorP/SprF [Pedobacter endophyticus]
MKKLSIILCILMLFKLVRAQQEAQFSQYMFNAIYINPAYAGYHEQLNIHGFYRNQWTGIEGAPKTLSFAIDAVANKGNVGLALNALSEKLGAQRTFSAFANYAYRVRMNNDGSSRLSFGIGLGLMQSGLAAELLNPNDYETNLPVGFYSLMMPEARAGVMFANDKFYAGFSAGNLISQFLKNEKYIFIPKPKPHYYLTAGLLLPLSANVYIKPSFLIKEDRAGPTSLDLNAFFIFYDRLWIGGSYRTAIALFDKPHLQNDLSKTNAAIAALQVFPAHFRIGYAYDFSIGPLRHYSEGAHELSIGYFFNRNNLRMRTPRYF